MPDTLAMTLWSISDTGLSPSDSLWTLSISLYVSLFIFTDRGFPLHYKLEGAQKESINTIYTYVQSIVLTVVAKCEYTVLYRAQSQSQLWYHWFPWRGSFCRCSKLPLLGSSQQGPDSSATWHLHLLVGPLHYLTECMSKSSLARSSLYNI